MAHVKTQPYSDNPWGSSKGATSGARQHVRSFRWPRGNVHVQIRVGEVRQVLAGYLWVEVRKQVMRVRWFCIEICL